MKNLPYILAALLFVNLHQLFAQKATVLFVGVDGFPLIDKTYREKLVAENFNVATCSLKSLTISSLQNCNVLVFTQFFVGGDFIPDEVKNTLWKWVENGGGLFFISGLMGYGDYNQLVENINSLLTPFDIMILFEQVRDEKHKEVYKGILNYTYFETRNISKGHPITEGISRIWYPGGGGQHASPVSTYTFKADAAWQILIKGEKEAYSPTYPSEPPLLACREFGKGRVALMSMDARYFINDGFHPAYGGYTLEKGDGFHLLSQIYQWLAEPSLKEGKIFTPNVQVEEEKISQPEEKKAVDATCEELLTKISTIRPFKTFKGVIGLHSTLSDGENEVDEFCLEAKRLGLDFVVFTETYELMDENKWKELVRKCEAQTKNEFVAIPGLQIQAPDGEVICFYLNRFPKKEEVENPPALLFNLNFPTIILSKPHFNRLNPWQYKFYTGIALYTYERGELIDEATSLYRELSANDYRLIPAAINKCFSLSELRHAVKEEVITFVNAECREHLVEHPDWQHNGPLRTVYGEGSSYVSSGLIFEILAVATKENLLSSFGAYGVYPGHKELFLLKISSQFPIKEVRVFKGTRLWRRFFPNQTHFSAYLWSHSTRDDEPLMVYAEDIRKRKLFSNSLRKPYNPFFSYTMCVDKQNSIIERSGIGWSAGWIAGLDVGAIFPLIPAEKLVPAGEDASWCPISSWETRPIFPLTEEEFRLLQGNPKNWSGWDILILNKRFCSFSSPDCVVIDNYYEKKFVRAKARYVYFRPLIKGINAILVEGDVEMKEQIPSKHKQLTIFRIMSNTATNPYERYAYESGGQVKKGSFIFQENTDSSVIERIPLAKGDWLALFPSPLGNVAVYSLCDLPLYGEIGLTNNLLHAFVSGNNKWRNYISLQLLPNSSSEIPKGAKWRYSYLFLLDNSLQKAPENFLELKKIYGIGCKPRYRVDAIKGRIENASFILSLQANEYEALLKFKNAKLPYGLGIRIKGINSNWDAGVFLKGKNEIRRIGVSDEGVGYCFLETIPEEEFFIGNLITCDDPDIRLQIICDTKYGYLLIAHNPHSKRVTISLKCPDILPYELKEKILTINPGETIIRKLKAKGGKR